MSSTSLLSSSPFVSALPSHLSFQYDVHGDAIMVDAATGSPILYGAPVNKRKLLSYDDDSSDESCISKSSKRSRTSSYNEGNVTFASVCSPIASVSSAVASQGPCPPAPLKVWRAAPDDTIDSVVNRYTGLIRNLMDEFTAHARAPVGPPAESLPLPSEFLPFDDFIAPPAESLPLPSEFLPLEEAVAAPQATADKDWCFTMRCHDLASLTMKDPLAFLYFLRFVDSYNDFAVEGEKINLPLIPLSVVNKAYFDTNLEALCELDVLLQHFPCKRGFLRGPPPIGLAEKVAAGKWNITMAYCTDFELPLEMGHPSVLLELSRFYTEYNRNLPENERIRIPLFSESSVEYIKEHSFFTEYPSGAEELMLFLDEHSYAEGQHNEWEEDSTDSYDNYYNPYDEHSDYEGPDCDDHDYHDGYDYSDYSEDDYDYDYDNNDDDDDDDSGYDSYPDSE